MFNMMMVREHVVEKNENLADYSMMRGFWVDMTALHDYTHKKIEECRKDMKYTFLNNFNTPNTNPVNTNQGTFGVMNDEEKQYFY